MSTKNRIVRHNSRLTEASLSREIERRPSNVLTESSIIGSPQILNKKAYKNNSYHQSIP